MPAGQLRNRLSFYAKEETSPDELGNMHLDWELQFTTAARIVPRLGGETITQARLSGKNPAMITVRWTRDTAEITTDWKAVDTRTGKEWNIRSAIADERRKYVEILAEEGVPS